MLRRLHKYLVYYNFLIAFCSLALTVYFTIIFSTHVSIEYYLFNFFATLGTYNYLRHYDGLKTFLKDRESPFFRLVCASLVICAGLYILLPSVVRLYYFPLIALVFFYNFPLTKKVTLRTVPFMKIFVIALVWVLSASSVIFFSDAGELTVKKIAFILAQIFFFIAITLPFDIKDMIYDRIKTIPNTIGVERSIAISQLCLAVYISLILIFGTNPVFKLAHVLFSFLALYVIYRQKEIEKLYKLYYYVDGLILAQTGFVLLFGQVMIK
jgi:hypothetical protein